LRSLYPDLTLTSLHSQTSNSSHDVSGSEQFEFFKQACICNVVNPMELQSHN
jgi:hypothetical protein